MVHTRRSYCNIYTWQDNRGLYSLSSMKAVNLEAVRFGSLFRHERLRIPVKLLMRMYLCVQPLVPSCGSRVPRPARHQGRRWRGYDICLGTVCRQHGPRRAQRQPRDQRRRVANCTIGWGNYSEGRLLSGFTYDDSQ